MNVLLLQFQSYKSTKEQSEALQNAWTALLWLKRDLQAARDIVVNQYGDSLILETPYFSGNRAIIKWRKIKYNHNLTKAQLQRDIHGSHNIVAENIIAFTVSFDPALRLATVSVSAREGFEMVHVSTKIWLRNMR